MKKENIEEKTEEIKKPEESIIAPEVAEEEKLEIEAKDVIEVVPEEEEIEKEIPKGSFDRERWTPKTSIGKKVKSGEINDIDQIIDNGLKIMEPEIVDILMPDAEIDLLLIGQSKGKFGGGKRRVFRQTQKKTREGNKPRFSTVVIIGNRNGHIGMGYGKARETVPAREKAMKSAKLNMIKIRRGCGSWQCGCRTPHSIPFKVVGKCGSVRLTLMPAPKGTGLVLEPECQKILRLAGIKDAWSDSLGQTVTKVNLVNACFEALKQTMKMKASTRNIEETGAAEGRVKK
ncbi:MAG: 30S ribosomal protein S5 [Candidatus Woesearchaeota archaeon]|nr:30S ribosomal protein S5 [Candidatus Woesearchaeota archaeon]